MREISAALNRGGIFPAVRHLAIANDFYSKRLVAAVKHILEPAGVWALMEGRGECRTSVGYTSIYTTRLSMRSPNHRSVINNKTVYALEMPLPSRAPAERKHSIVFVGQVDTRNGYKDRLAVLQSKGQIPGAPYILGSFPRGKHKKRPNIDKLGLRFCTSPGDTDRCILLHARLGLQEMQRVTEASNYTLCLRGDTLGTDRVINGMAAGTAIIMV